MPYKRSLRLLPAIAACTLTGACALLPDFSSDGMSSSEQASLNLQMGVRYLEMNMLEIAKEKLDAAYSQDSGNPEVLNALAVFYERIKNDEMAADYYASAVDKDPENFSLKNNYGHFLCDHGKHEKGQAMLQEALDSPYNNRPWMALTNLGICQLRQSNAAKAEEYFRGALQINPEYPAALQEMIKISYDKQQYMSARAFLERVTGVSKQTPETLWFGFQIERALGNGKAADDYKEQLVNTFPTSTQATQVKSAISK